MYRGNKISYLVLNVLEIATICSSQFLKVASAFFNNALILFILLKCAGQSHSASRVFGLLLSFKVIKVQINYKAVIQW